MIGMISYEPLWLRGLYSVNLIGDATAVEGGKFHFLIFDLKYEYWPVVALTVQMAFAFMAAPMDLITAASAGVHL
jgi:hypothetical protein